MTLHPLGNLLRFQQLLWSDPEVPTTHSIRGEAGAGMRRQKKLIAAIAAEVSGNPTSGQALNVRRGRSHKSA